MHPIRSSFHRGRRAGLALAWLTMSPAVARADLAGPSLRQLVTQASAVVVGSVTSVTTSPDGKTQRATVAVAHALAGTPPASIALAWRIGDPEGVSAGSGDRLLLILRPAAPGGPATHDVVSPVGGMTPLSPLSEPPARALVTTALANGGDVPLATMIALAAGDGPHPPVTLVNAALDDLTGRVGPADGPPIGAVACAAPGSHQRVVRLWALEQVGRTASAEGLACARTLIKTALPTKAHPAGGDLPAVLAGLRGLAADPSPIGISTINTLVKQITRFFPFGSEKCAGEVSPLIGSATASLAATRDPRAVSTLYKMAVKRPIRAAASTAVHGLRLIGDARAEHYLARLAERHPDARIRQQALESLAGLAG